MSDKLEVLKYYLCYKYRRQFTGRKQLEDWQNRRLSAHIDYVAGHSAVYLGKKKLEDFPVIDKSFMMEHFNELNTVGIDRDQAMEFAVKAERERDFTPKMKGTTVGLSSGTSGRRGIFLVSDSEKNRWAGYILAKFLPGSILETYPIAFFMRADSNLYQAVSSKNIQFHFFDIYRDMEEHRERLEAIRPRILAGQPSLLIMLAKAMNRGELHIRPEVVISIAEVLEKEDESRLKEAFGLPVIHQVYQCTEGCLASTCRCGTLHLNEDIVHIEKEYLDEKRFIPVVTDFERKAQPIIRYRLNDILVERSGPCPCGSPFTALEKIEGREDDVFVFCGADGNPVSVFPDFIRRCVLFSVDMEAPGAGGRGCESEDGELMAEREKRETDLGDTEERGSRSVVNAEPEMGNGILTAGVLHSGDYRIVQENEGITIYSDLTEAEKARVRLEFEKLAKDRGFVLPELTFTAYFCEKGRKMKRVERKGQTGDTYEESEGKIGRMGKGDC